jgi:TetR/AcrR family transcriptional regulator
MTDLAVDRRQRAPERTRARLLEAAKHLFARHGLHGVAVAEIAKRAEVSVGMINHHFGGKDELYRACLDEFAEIRLRALDRFLAPPASEAELVVRVKLLIGDLLDLHLAHPDVVAILLRDVNAAELWGPELEKKLYEFTPRLAKFFAQALKLGLVRADVDPIVVASALYLSLSALLQADAHRARVSGASLRDERTRARVVAQLIDVVLYGALPR